jgi:hypothetical protein
MSTPDIGRNRKLAADKDRDATLDMLARAVADGRLTMEEYENRITAALTARTFADLDTVVSDLPEDAPRPAPLVAADDNITAIFGNETRKGQWTVPVHFSVTSIFGDCHIEMKQARLQGPVVRIDAIAFFGSVTILVPDGIDVRLTGPAFFGSKSVKLRRARAGAPVLNVRCTILFGSVTVKRRG